MNFTSACAHGIAWEQACPMCGRMASVTFTPTGPLGPAGGLTPSPPMGCICPPTSEKTCENPVCPRQNPFKRSGVGNDLNRPQTT